MRSSGAERVCAAMKYDERRIAADALQKAIVWLLNSKKICCSPQLTAS